MSTNTKAVDALREEIVALREEVRQLRLAQAFNRPTIVYVHVPQPIPLQPWPWSPAQPYWRVDQPYRQPCLQQPPFYGNQQQLDYRPAGAS